MFAMSEALRKTGLPPDRPGAIRNCIVIGGSAGGYAAIREVMKDLTEDIPAAIILLLHRWSAREIDFRTSLKAIGHLPIAEIADGVQLREGAVFIVPPSKGVIFRDGALYLEQMTKHDYPRQAINQFFVSAAKVYGGGVIGVILSGMLSDGTAGFRAIAQAGGVTIVQADAEHPGMSISAKEDWPVTFCLNLAEIGDALELLCRRKACLETGVTVAVRLLKDRLALLARLMDQSKNNAPTTRFLTAEVTSLREDLRTIEKLLPRFRTRAKAARPPTRKG
jgi:two-component system chemotaxis response regulator CheB